MSDYSLRVWEAAAYPFRRPLRAALLGGLAAGIALARYLPWSGRRNALPVVFLFLVAYAVSYLFHVVIETSTEEEYRENPLRGVDFKEALLNLAQFAGAFAVSFLPVFGLLVWALMKDGVPFEDGAFLVFLGLAALAGTTYFPMAVLLLGFTGTWVAAFNLPLGVRGIGRIGSDYWICFAFFAVLVAVSTFLEISWVGPRERLSGAGLAAFLGTTFAEVYLAVVAMRAAGRLYSLYRERLGWQAGPEA